MTSKGQLRRRLPDRQNTKSARSSHYVCFDCRKQFQKPSAAAYVEANGRPYLIWQGHDSHQLSYPCPQCGKEMRLIGKNFRAPKQDDVEGWEVARRLLDAGFHYWGWEGQLPTHVRDVQAFIAKNRPKSAGERMLEKWEAKQ